MPILLTGSLAASMHLTMPTEATAAPHSPTPRSSTPAPAPLAQVAAPAAVQAPPAQYTVASGDTVSTIAARYGLATASLLALNGLSWSSLIFPGQVLNLTGATATPAATPAPSPQSPAPQSPSSQSSYTVVAGDTVSGIAADHGVSVAAIYAANGLGAASIIYPGQSLALPAGAPAASGSVSPPAPAPAPTPQATNDVVTPLSAEMAVNASIIITTARSLGVGDEAIVVALAAAAQESSLRNVQFGDRDSLGLFQQRSSQGWGTPEQLLDPVRATTAFFGGKANPNPGLTRGLLDIPNWTSMTVTDAAQAVQKSAHPGEYAKWETSARSWLGQLR
ncbi:LysM domain-containing protein [Mycetocola sp. 2940]|uniref:LysM peptidoglycan-binding domain-containing protein n=1 Tax=Mycetocola sp. 2940 TaxID=3156452 RepID=UPI00339442C7